MKILVVDDEKVLVKGLKFNLEADGYTVDTAYDGLEAVDKARANHYDLIMMDVMMPQLDGLEACMRIRDFSQVPIIMLTARSDDMDKLMGFEYGVDDYITKPFNILEVKARVRALLRRSAIASDAAGGSDTLIEHGGIKIDTEKRTAFKNNAPVELTAKEYELIELLIKHPGRVYSRDSLLNIIWGYEYQGDIRTVDVHVRRLREKLEQDPASPACIMTKWGVGYYFKE